ncbi:killer toxin resistant protein [Paecilomyces lecythidis]|uniref:Killer toxin resistant protein n=1 Tax=Paecilomyces lecythidis TaxID=3004212 RepID=A0ABR3WPM9_9EURO
MLAARLCHLWQSSLVLITIVLPLLVQASPSVNVALQASFNSAPYLLELLETAAEENPTSYFPLLDRIAEGAFEQSVTEKELYDRFLEILKEDGYLVDPESLSSFKLALSIRSAAPRIEAHYQFYNTSVQPSLSLAQDAACPVWAHLDGEQYCSSALERAQQGVDGELDPRALPFDRVLGDISASPSILYADITSPLFKEFHLKLSALAREGQISYRVRYRPPQHAEVKPLFVSGYGVELALKRTDYIVIDDREAEPKDQKSSAGKKPSIAGIDALKEESPADLKPLSSSELSSLGLSAASFIMNSANPLETFLKVVEDFPKHSSAIATHNATAEFLTEFRANRGGSLSLPSGYNVMWINGVQISPRQIDAFSLLEHIRKERKLITRFKDLGLSAQDAVNLLWHPALTEVQTAQEPQRYDYRDKAEGGDVIIWLNNIEKDKRYEGWPTALVALLQRSRPGQLPPVRRNIHNVVIPVDLSDIDDVRLVVETLQTFVKRKIPVQFGLVPTVNSPDAISQLKIVHHLHDSYGLAATLQYLEEKLLSKNVASPDKSSFQSATKDRKLRPNAKALAFEDVKEDELEGIVSRTTRYLQRLDALDGRPPTFVNGVPLARDENWIQGLTMRVNRDLQAILQGVFEEIFEEDAWLGEYFLSQAAQSRNKLIIPEDAKDIRIADLISLYEKHGDSIKDLPRWNSASGQGHSLESQHIIVVGDLDTRSGLDLLATILRYRRLHREAEILFIHNPSVDSPSDTSAKLTKILQDDKIDTTALVADIDSNNVKREISEAEADEISKYWSTKQPLARELGFEPGTRGLVFNGRAIGPIPSSATLAAIDMEQLLAYEKSQRLDPLAKAVKSLGAESKLADPSSFAKVTSLVALSSIPDIPEGLFDTASTARLNVFTKWESTYTAITTSTSEDAVINVVATIDPTSEAAQRWVPILNVLSKMDGVNTKIFLNPKEQIQDIPIKRFYRHVLEAEPSFNSDGSLARPGASFSGLPVEALLTLGMDVPAPWLVAPKESIHDLDNIKLSSVKDGSDVDAVYELKHILIEGHSRDTTTLSPPRGVQLLLGTKNNPYFADTIIMANLGYFQFKSQPGFWNIELKPGRSQRIFNLDSVGSLGYTPQPGDDNNEVALLSFRGKTLFPRLSRKPGHEDDEVLDIGPSPGSAMDYVSKGFNFASSVLSSVGMKGSSSEKHADINIFSVASGHLYERMLNIMMVSVMRNTKHTVKFWFIEQFLSPSFKSFLPHLAKEYGFSYEMVAYKWPHWLRGQQEKQREIWGYKILFLDVLFPLSLDKVIFVDADQIVRTDMYDLVTLDLEGAPYGFTPMCDSRESMEGFRFWKQGYWKTFLRGQPYHISALYVVDLNRFRALAAGDRLRGQYQALSADPNSLSNLDQDLPNNMQHQIPIKSLPQEWLWCETWCSDESQAQARTIDLCNNPMTKEPKLDRARRQVPEWTEYDEEIASLAKRIAAENEKDQAARAETQPEKEAEDEAAWKKDEL